MPPPEWDLLLDKIPSTHFEQTSGYGAVRARYGWQQLHVLAKHQGRHVGGVQVFTRGLGRFGKIGYISRGPATDPSCAGLDVGLIDQVEKIARSERWLYLVIDYAYAAQGLADAMGARGYRRHPEGIPPTGLFTATVLLDITPSEEALLSGMTTNARRDVRRGQRSGLQFREGSFSDLPTFRRLMLATCARRNAAPSPPQPDYFEQLWRQLGEAGHVRVFLVSFEQEIISAAFVFTISDTLRVWKVGWSGSHPDKEPNRWMWWEIIRWGKARNFKTLDFVWLDSEDAERIRQGHTSSSGFRDGTTSFKLGFGGQVQFLPAARSKFFHPVIRLAFRCGGRRLLASDRFQRLLRRYWAGKLAS